MAFPQQLASQGTVLVVGGGGFVAGFIVARLRQNGWTVRRGVRRGSGPGGQLLEDEVLCELRDLITPEAWAPLLEGVDAVVNAAGIFHEAGKQTFELVHHIAPLALARACEEMDISRFVQISAAGRPDDGPFIRWRHELDEALLGMELDAVILRPSAVYSTSGSYGSSSLMRAWAGFPWFSLLPGRSMQPIQPVAAEDLGRIAAEAVDRGRDGIYEVGARNPISLRDYQSQWRRWLRIPGNREVHLSPGLVNAQVATWEMFRSGAFGRALWKLMRRGNELDASAWEKVEQAFGFAPRSVEEVLESHPSQVQDRWHAQLYFLAPTLKFTIVALLLLAAAANILAPDTANSSPYGLWAMIQDMAGPISGIVKLSLAAWLGFSRNPRRPIFWISMFFLAQTIALTISSPQWWMDPMGGLAKNLVLLPALAVLWVLSDRR